MLTCPVGGCWPSCTNGRSKNCCNGMRSRNGICLIMLHETHAMTHAGLVTSQRRYIRAEPSMFYINYRLNSEYCNLVPGTGKGAKYSDQRICLSVRSHISTRNSSGDDIVNVNFFYDDIFNRFYAVRPGSYRIG